MVTILQGLKVSSAQRFIQKSPIIYRRERILTNIAEQIEAANAFLDGKPFTAKVSYIARDKLTGEQTLIEKHKRFRPCWWIGEDGGYFLELRYGWRSLTIAKGKTTVEVGDASKLVPTLELLRDAVLVGELDEQLNAASSKLADRLHSKRTPAKV